MAINRNKVTAAAQKYIQKGAYKKAIKEYKKIIKEHPDDVRVLLKIGDIQARDGQSETAARTYNEVADHYVAHGFFLKAVAAYKLLLGVDPGNVEAKLRLADLYFQLGLLRDALANYQAVAAVFNERGWIDRYLQTLQKVVDIDPDHAGNRIKYAEELARFDHEVGAAEQFMIAAAALRREGRFEEFTKVMERYIHLSPADVKAVHDICRIYLQQNRPKRALVRIQAAFKANPRDETTVDILVNALDALNERGRAVGVLKELAQRHANDGAKGAADATYRRVLELAPNDPDAMSALGIAPAGSGPGAGAPLMTFDVVDAPPATAEPAPAEVDEGEVEKLLSETDVYLKYNLYEKALEHLQKVFELDPQNVEGMERRKTALIATGQDGLAVSVLIGLARIVHPSDEVRAMAYLHQALSTAPGDPAVVQVMTELGGVAPEADQHVTEVIVVESPPSQAQTEPVDVAASTAATNVVAPAAPPTFDDASFDKLDALFDDFSKEDTAAGHKVLSEEFARADTGEDESDVVSLGTDEILPAELDEGLENAEKQIAAGAVEDARMLLFELLGEFPEHAELLLRRMDELPESEPEPETTVGAADDLFLSDSTFPSEDSEAAFDAALPPVEPPKLPGGDAPVIEFEVADEPPAVEAAPTEFEVADEPPAVQAAPIEFEVADEPPAAEAAPIEFEVADEPPAAEAAPIEFAVDEEPPAAEAAPIEFAVDEEPPAYAAEAPVELEPTEDAAEEAATEEAAAEEAAAEEAAAEEAAAEEAAAEEAAAEEAAAEEAAAEEAAAEEAAAEEAAAEQDAAEEAAAEEAAAEEAAAEEDADAASLPELPHATSGQPRAQSSNTAGFVRRDSVSGDQLAVSSGSSRRVLVTPVPASLSTESSVTDVALPKTVQVVERDAATDTVAAALEGDGLEVSEDAIAEAERRKSGQFEVAEEQLKSADTALPDADDAAATDVDELEILEDDIEIDDLEIDADGFDELDEIEITDFDDDDDDVEFEEIDESEFDTSASASGAAAEYAEDAAYAAEARENEVDAPIGRGSSFVTLTFGPADEVVADDGGSGVGAAITMRRSGEGMAAMFELEAAADGPHGLAASFELSLASIEMGLYFEGISTLEQLLGNMEIGQNDRLLVHYHLGIAYEAMHQQQLAEANFRVVATSAPDMFPDVFLRLERMNG